MSDLNNDLFPALLAAALYARRKGGDKPSDLGGLLTEPTRPLDFSPSDEVDVEQDIEVEIAA